MRFDHFAALLTGDTSLSPPHQIELFGNLTYYLCKHGLERWRHVGRLLRDLSPPVHSEPGAPGQGWA